MIKSRAVDCIKYTGDNIDEIWAWFDKHGLQKVRTLPGVLFEVKYYFVIYEDKHYETMSEFAFNRQFEVTDE